jgi:uncharacterized membrane protein
VAFVTGTVMASETTSSHSMISIFIPTTPNPTSGWYAVVPESDVVNLSISIEDAFKVLLSGGIVGPNLAESIPPERLLASTNLASPSEAAEGPRPVLKLNQPVLE